MINPGEIGLITSPSTSTAGPQARPSGNATMAYLRAIGAVHAKGGIFMRPTFGLIGEAGPEAVIPLANFGRGGHTQAPIELTVNALHGNEIERSVKIRDMLIPLARHEGSLLKGLA